MTAWQHHFKLQAGPALLYNVAGGAAAGQLPMLDMMAGAGRIWLSVVSLLQGGRAAASCRQGAGLRGSRAYQAIQAMLRLSSASGAAVPAVSRSSFQGVTILARPRASTAAAPTGEKAPITAAHRPIPTTFLT